MQFPCAFWFACLCVVFGSIPTHADLRAWLTAAPVFDVQQWTTEDGLPQNTVRCLSQDAAGYLWAGTLDGVARFDGREWTDLTPLLHQAHPTELRVDDIEADLDGFVWLVCQERLFVFRGGRFQHVSLGDSAADHRITDILRCSRGGLWVGTLEHGVLRLRNGRIEGAWAKREGLRYNRVRKLYEDREGVLWVIQNPDGVWSQGGGAIHPQAHENQKEQHARYSLRDTKVHPPRGHLLFIVLGDGLGR